MGWWPREYFEFFGIDFQHKYHINSGFPVSVVKSKDLPILGPHSIRSSKPCTAVFVPEHVAASGISVFPETPIGIWVKELKLLRLEQKGLRVGNMAVTE